MVVLVKELMDGYNRWIYEYSDQRTINWPLMGSPVPVLSILGIYLWFILKGGPVFMNKRKPFQVDKIVQVYNVLQVLVCARLTWIGVSNAYGPWGKISILCAPIDYSDDPFTSFSLGIYYEYFLLKLLDLCDTVFFVVRKKQSQVSFLHVYHHVLMVFLCWLAIRFTPGGQLIFAGIINSFVHTVMYTYYFLTSYNKEYRKIVWWKKYITQLQMFQFAAIFVHLVAILLQPSCDFPRSVIFFLLPQVVIIFSLFANFYRKTYMTEGQTSKLESSKTS